MNKSFIYNSDTFRFPNLTNYDLETRGRLKYNWHNTSEGLTAICKFWKNSMGWINDTCKNTTSTLGEEILKVLEDWISSYTLQISLLCGSDIPWGEDWKAFAIESTTLLAYYILLNRNNYLSDIAADTILIFIREPNNSFGCKRSNMDAAAMLFPWVVATQLKSSKIISQFNFTRYNYLYSNQDGLHLDLAYINNNYYIYENLAKFEEVCYNTEQVLFEVNWLAPIEHIQKVNFIIRHPTIPISGGALHHNRADISAPTYRGDNTGSQVQVIPSMRYLRYFTKHSQWCVKMTKPFTAYYVSDSSVSNMALYALLDRRVYYSDSTDINPVFPVAGFITKKGTLNLPTVVRDNTTKHYIKSYYDTKSYVFTDHVLYAVAHQSQVTVPGIIDTKFNETVVLDIPNKIAKIYYHVEDFKHYQICLDDNKNEDMSSSDYMMTIDFNNRTIKGVALRRTLTLGDMTHGLYAAKQSEQSDGIIILKNNTPCFYVVGESDLMLPKLRRSLEGVYHDFIFDFEGNQYIKAIE